MKKNKEDCLDKKTEKELEEYFFQYFLEEGLSEEDARKKAKEQTKALKEENALNDQIINEKNEVIDIIDYYENTEDI